MTSPVSNLCPLDMECFCFSVSVFTSLYLESYACFLNYALDSRVGSTPGPSHTCDLVYICCVFISRMSSAGAYSDSFGLDVVRRDIAAYINKRDEAELADYLSTPQGTCTCSSMMHLLTQAAYWSKRRSNRLSKCSQKNFPHNTSAYRGGRASSTRAVRVPERAPECGREWGHHDAAAAARHGRARQRPARRRANPHPAVPALLGHQYAFQCVPGTSLLSASHARFYIFTKSELLAFSQTNNMYR